VVFVPGSSSRQPSGDDGDSSDMGPPHIPRSLDGEEGYCTSQRLLQQTDIDQTEKIINPPPNKTVCQGESPPSYQRAQSLSQLDRSRYLGRAGRNCSSHPCVQTVLSAQHTGHPTSQAISSHNNNNRCKHTEQPHIGGLPVLLACYQSNNNKTANPRSGRFLSDPTSQLCASSNVGDVYRTDRVCSDPSDSRRDRHLRPCSDNSLGEPSSYQELPHYSPNSDVDVFDMLNQPDDS
jgi:hypothetical protein